MADTKCVRPALSASVNYVGLMSAVIVVEERLRTTGMTIVLSVVAVIVAGADILVASRSSGTRSLSIAEFLMSVMVLTMVALIVMSHRIIVRVIEGETGRIFEVLYGPGPIMVQRFGPGEILSASAQDLPFSQMGGWGYRGSLRFFKYAALVTRRGESLRVNLSGGRRFVVTVDEPAAFAHALNTRPGNTADNEGPA
jgi:hypothetical protein